MIRAQNGVEILLKNGTRLSRVQPVLERYRQQADLRQQIPSRSGKNRS